MLFPAFKNLTVAAVAILGILPATSLLNRFHTLPFCRALRKSLLILETIRRTPGCDLSPLDTKHPLQLFRQKEVEDADILAEAFTLLHVYVTRHHHLLRSCLYYWHLFSQQGIRRKVQVRWSQNIQFYVFSRFTKAEGCLHLQSKAISFSSYRGSNKSWLAYCVEMQISSLI